MHSHRRHIIRGHYPRSWNPHQWSLIASRLDRDFAASSAADHTNSSRENARRRRSSKRVESIRANFGHSTLEEGLIPAVAPEGAFGVGEELREGMVIGEVLQPDERTSQKQYKAKHRSSNNRQRR